MPTAGDKPMTGTDLIVLAPWIVSAQGWPSSAFC
jgi:hypothetical protein